MKRRRLSVRIDGIWYRVAHGKLHKITREVAGHAGRSRVQPLIAKAYNRVSSPDVSDQAFVDDNMAMCSTDEQPARRTTPSLSRRLAFPERNEASKWQSSWKCSGRREDHPREPEVCSGIDGLCSFVGGRPQEEPFFELDDSGQVSGNESSMSTATSARKPLVIRIKMTNVSGQ